MNRKKVQLFNDGTLMLCKLKDSEEKLYPVFPNLRFENRTIGAERFFKAREAQHKISMLVRIPQAKGVSDEDIAVIGDMQYRILQLQTINDTCPRCWQLTLEKVKKRQIFKNGH